MLQAFVNLPWGGKSGWDDCCHIKHIKHVIFVVHKSMCNEVRTNIQETKKKHFVIERTVACPVIYFRIVKVYITVRWQSLINPTFFFIFQLIVSSFKMSYNEALFKKLWEMSITSPESRGDDFFCPTNSPKPNVWFTIIYNRQPANVLRFCLINNLRQLINYLHYCQCYSTSLIASAHLFAPDGLWNVLTNVF